MKTTNITDFRDNLKKHLDSIINDRDILIIPRKKEGIVIMTLDLYNKLKNKQ